MRSRTWEWEHTSVAVALTQELNGSALWQPLGAEATRKRLNRLWRACVRRFIARHERLTHNDSDEHRKEVQP